MHTNNCNPCPQCIAIMGRYPGFDPVLAKALSDFRLFDPEIHVAVAGRNEADQDAALKAGRSKAAFGKSPHNYNLAFDLFRLLPTGAACFDIDWYKSTVAPLVRQNPNLAWSGDWDGPFHEYDHVERKQWQALAGRDPFPLLKQGSTRSPAG